MTNREELLELLEDLERNDKDTKEGDKRVALPGGARSRALILLWADGMPHVARIPKQQRDFNGPMMIQRIHGEWRVMAWSCD